MEQGYFHRVTAQSPTRFWINNVTREEADIAQKAGAVGCTQNPSYTWKMLSHPAEKDYAWSLADPIILNEPDDNEVEIKLQARLVSVIAEAFHPLWVRSGARYGWVSIQGDPFREDADTIIRCARENRKAGENIIAKVPATEDGLEAIEVLIAERVPINATEVFAVKQAMDLCDVYERAAKGMRNPPPVFYSHITGIYDEYLSNYVKSAGVKISPDVLWQAGLAVARKCYRMVKDRGTPIHFIGGGARGFQHFTEMVGADACITVNWKGFAEDLINADPPVVYRFDTPVPEKVIDELVEKLPDFRKGFFVNDIESSEYEEFGPVVLFRTYFEDAWNDARKAISTRRAELA